MLGSQCPLQLRAARHECRVGAQRNAERQLLVPAQAAELQQVQVRCALVIFHYDRESALRPAVEFGKDEAPASRAQGLRAVESGN